jgi:hypothetical protein
VRTTYFEDCGYAVGVMGGNSEFWAHDEFDAAKASAVTQALLGEKIVMWKHHPGHRPWEVIFSCDPSEPVGKRT